jgi:2-dehydropantoate 2-reductase
MTENLIAVVGPGAIGGLVAAMLQRAGHDVVVVARERTAQQVSEHGLDVETDEFGTWHAPLAAATAVPHGARVIVAVKAEGVADAAALLAGTAPTEVISLLNGLDHLGVLRAALPGVRVVGATIAGETLRTGAGGFGPALVRHRGTLLRVVVPDDSAQLRGILGGFPAPMRSSLQADIEAGHEGELDAIGGAVRRRAASHGIPTPHLADVIGRIETRAAAGAHPA